MRGPLVVFSLLLAFAGGALCGYVWQERKVLSLRKKVEWLEAKQEKGRRRETALRAQLEEAQQAREAVGEEARRLQENLAARLSRLEGIASALAQEHRQDQGASESQELP